MQYYYITVTYMLPKKYFRGAKDIVWSFNIISHLFSVDRNKMRIRKGRLRLSPNEEAALLKEETEKRRKLRLQQVREQSKENAAKIRQSVKQEKHRQLMKLATDIKVMNTSQTGYSAEYKQQTCLALNLGSFFVNLRNVSIRFFKHHTEMGLPDGMDIQTDHFLYWWCRSIL